MSDDFKSSKPLALDTARNQVFYTLNRRDLEPNERAVIEQAVEILNTIASTKPRRHHAAV